MSKNIDTVKKNIICHTDRANNTKNTGVYGRMINTHLVLHIAQKQ